VFTDFANTLRQFSGNKCPTRQRVGRGGGGSGPQTGGGSFSAYPPGYGDAYAQLAAFISFINGTVFVVTHTIEFK
jgi:hypothetical protein